MRLWVVPVGTSFLQSLPAMRKVISGKGSKKIESKILLLIFNIIFNVDEYGGLVSFIRVLCQKESIN